MVEQVYRPRRPKESPLWQCLSRHFDEFIEAYEERYQPRYGFLRPIIPEVVDKFLTCADLKQGFARIRCDNCKHEFILPYSCRQRYFCPSCHQKKVQLFGELLTETILYPVPHRHLTLGIPKMLRPYFRHDRDLLKDLCRIAHTCLLEYLRATLDLPEGIPGIVMTIHSYGEYLDWHPHLHLLMADGLFMRSGLFYVLPQVSLKPLEGLFRARLITFLVDKGLLPPARANMLRSWVHSGFNVHRSRRVQPHEREDMQRLAQYIMRNPFSLESRAEGETGCPQGSNGAKRSGNWRELIKRVWESDPLLCPKCHNEMRIVSLIDDPEVIERILRHLGLWEQGVRVLPTRACPEPCPKGSGSRAPPELVNRVIEPCFDDPFPDYDTEPVMAYANG